MTIRLRTALLLAMVASLALAGAAAAKPVPAKPPARVQIGRAELVPRPNGTATLLVPVLYPVQYAGRVVRTTVSVSSGGRLSRFLGVRARVGNGRVRRPERRRRFLFVHRFRLGRSFLAGSDGGLTVRVAAGGPIDINRDGKPEIRSQDRSTQSLRGAASPRGLCSSIPSLRLRPGRSASMPLPICDTPVRWEVFYPRLHGSARIRRGHLVYRARRRFRGSEVVQLLGTRPRQAAGMSDLEPLVVARARVTVGIGGGDVVRAIGDSVTAGFGYYSDGRSMTIGHLLECQPGEKAFDDACSSNSLNRTNRGTKVEYAPDYGLSNNVSWAAQWANEHGVTNYENLAISGSEPADWAPGGEFHETTARVESEDPDYVLMTMGANPLLSEMLFGVDNMGCAVYSDVFGGYRECVERAFAEVHLQRNLKSLYEDLVDHTNATIYLMQYHLAVPSTALAYSAVQIAEMGKLLDREIATIAGEVDPQRLQVVTPPHFNVGIDISPVYPSRYTCSDFGYEVDGPSVQSNPTQDELEVLHPLSFCEGPPIGQPWIISGDTGIHPSAAGYAQMASQVPPPTE